MSSVNFIMFFMLIFLISIILILISWGMCIVDSFTNIRIIFGMLLILIPPLFIFYFPFFENKKRFKIAIILFVIGVPIPLLMGILSFLNF